jgi:iron complex outermembrane recepter protein
MKKNCLLLLFVLVSIYIFASDRFEGTGVIKGKITTSDGKSAAEVTVLIKGTAKGTFTDEHGVFEFRNLH